MILSEEEACVLEEMERRSNIGICGFWKYGKTRLITALVGLGVLYLFSDIIGYPAWLTNLIWIPIAWIWHYKMLK